MGLFYICLIVKVTFSSRNIKFTQHEYDLLSMMIILITWLRKSLSSFSTVKFPLPRPPLISILYSLDGSYCVNPIVRVFHLKVKYLHKYLSFFSYGRFVYYTPLIYLVKYLCISSIWTHGCLLYLSYNLTVIILLKFVRIVPASVMGNSFSWLMCPFDIHPLFWFSNIFLHSCTEKCYMIILCILNSKFKFLLEF